MRFANQRKEALAHDIDSETGVLPGGGAAASETARRLRDGMLHLRNATVGDHGRVADAGEREAELQAALADLRAVVLAAGSLQAPENAQKARRCLALALFSAACERMRAQKPGEETRSLFDEAVSLAPGLGDERRDEARRYLAYVTYAVGKERLLKRDFGAAAECFETALDPANELKRWLSAEHVRQS